MRETVIMSEKELDRLHVLRKVQENDITQVKAAQLLKISDRQVRNLLSRIEKEGVEGVISRRVGKPSNRRIADDIKRQVLKKIEEVYPGFGPTLVTEKLAEIDGISLSTQTVRNWMIEAGMWKPRKGKKRNLHPPRPRRSCFGELIQADGSWHKWFGPNVPKANLTVLIDDATSAITALVFSEQECLDSYYAAFEQHISRHGRPRALYTDRWASFREQKNVTQAQRALRDLDIELILANSPQAKGRVERANRTLQDRLVKELYLRGIKTIEEANIFAAEFIETFNKKFSKKPMSRFDAHRSLEGYDLDRILCPYEERTLSSCGIFQFKNHHYQLQGANEFRRLAKRKIEIRELRKGGMRFFLGGKETYALRTDRIRDPSLDQRELMRIPEMDRKQIMGWCPGGNSRVDTPQRVSGPDPSCYIRTNQGVRATRRRYH